MKSKIILLISFLFIVIIIDSSAQSLYVVNKSGNQSIYSLSNIKRITFSAGDINILKTDNTIGIFAVKDLRVLTFANILTNNKVSIKANASNGHLKLFPNPANNFLNLQIEGFEGQFATISIITPDGRVVYSKTAVKTEDLMNISITHLPKGSYLCQISNHTFCKVVKFIKQ